MKTAPKNSRPLLGPALQHLVQIAAIAAPVLYGVGRTYLDGYWSLLGLPGRLSGYSVDDYLYTGFIAALEVFKLGGEPKASTFVLAASIGALIGVLNALLEPKARAQLSRVVQQWIGDYATATVIVLGVLAVWATAVVVVLASSTLGTQRAERVKKNFEAAAAAGRGTVAEFVINGDRSSGLLMECSAWCVVYQRGDFIAVPNAAVTLIRRAETPVPPSRQSPRPREQLPMAR